MRKAIRLTLVLALLVLLAAPTALAQEVPEPVPTSLSISTTFVGVSVKPGDTASFPIDVAAPPGSRVSLATTGVPDGWDSRLQGGGFVVNEVLLGENGRASVDFDVDIPADAAEGEYAFTVTASGPSGSDRLDLSVIVTAEAGGEVTLTTDFPALQGPSDSTYNFSLQLENGTPAEIQFGLSAQAPAGWQVDVKPSGEAKAATVTVGPGDKSTVTVDVDPPDTAAAGKYVIVAQADGGGQSASAELGVEITGSFDIQLSTANEVLNLDANAGEASNLDLIVFNTGTAPLEGVVLTASPPTGWDVTFQPSQVDVIAPGDSAPVTAVITPSEDAINGDYVLTLTASVPEGKSSADIRTTVKTSAVWGLVGIGVIVVALIGLSLVFRRYGRR